MALKKLSLVRGSDKTYTLAFTKADGTPYCLKNCVVFFTLKTQYDLPDSAASLQKIVTAFSDTTSGTSGTALVTLARADTLVLDPGEYDYDFSLLTAGSKTQVMQRGKLTLQPNITKSTGTAGTAA